MPYVQDDSGRASREEVKREGLRSQGLGTGGWGKEGSRDLACRGGFCWASTGRYCLVPTF